MAVENNKHWWQASLLTEQSNYNNFQNIFIFILFYFIFKTLQNCISFAKYQNESATVVLR